MIVIRIVENITLVPGAGTIHPYIDSAKRLLCVIRAQ